MMEKQNKINTEASSSYAGNGNEDQESGAPHEVHSNTTDIDTLTGTREALHHNAAHWAVPELAEHKESQRQLDQQLQGELDQYVRYENERSFDERRTRLRAKIGAGLREMRVKREVLKEAMSEPGMQTAGATTYDVSQSETQSHFAASPVQIPTKQTESVLTDSSEGKMQAGEPRKRKRGRRGKGRKANLMS